jgi:hypothetical protein
MQSGTHCLGTGTSIASGGWGCWPGRQKFTQFCTARAMAVGGAPCPGRHGIGISRHPGAGARAAGAGGCGPPPVSIGQSGTHGGTSGWPGPVEGCGGDCPGRQIGRQAPPPGSGADCAAGAGFAGGPTGTHTFGKSPPPPGSGGPSLSPTHPASTSAATAINPTSARRRPRGPAVPPMAPPTRAPSSRPRLSLLVSALVASQSIEDLR